MELLNHFFDFFIPRFCTACRTKLLHKEFFICNSCIKEIKIPSKERIKEEFERKFLNDQIITSFTSAYIFEKQKPLQYLIHSLKYEENFRIGIYLGKKVAEACKETIVNWHADYLVPVPLHHVKKAERGYNQSHFIAKGIGSALKIKVNNQIIKRRKYTNTQTELTLLERKDNIKDAFEISKSKMFQGKTLILVDDVITTGATITECGKILKENGAAKIYALSVAIAN